MYNAHGLMPDPYVGSFERGLLSCDCYGPGADPWALHKVLIQLSFLPVLLASWIATRKSIPYLVAWGAYFVVQAVQAQLTGNLQVNEMLADAIILAVLFLTAYGVVKLTPTFMRIVHIRNGTK